MSKTLFANSKAALVFAATTIVGALVMVGPGEGGGVLDATVDRLAQERESIAEEARIVSEERSEVIEPLDPAGGWGGTADPVFGDYAAEEVTAPAPEDQPVSAGTPRAAGATYAPPVPVGGPVKADAPGIVVPGEDDAREQAISRATPVVTSRVLKIEPQ